MKNTKVVFMGTPVFATKILEKLIENTNVVLVVSQKDKPIGRKQILTPSPVKKMALEHNIPVFTPDKIRNDYEEVKKYNPDLIVTCAYGQILSEDILNIPSIASINVHASLLPKYRGGAPIHRAIMNGDKKTGITIMYMDKGMDSGDIISTREVDILNDDNIETLSDKLSSVGAELLIETLPSIVEGTNTRIKQNEEEVTFAKIITKEDERIDFDDTAENIYNKIRALYKEPGSYFTLNNNVIKVIEAKIGDNKSEVNKVTVYKKALGIGTKTNEILITKLKPSGKKEMDAASFLNGTNKEELSRGIINGNFKENQK